MAKDAMIENDSLEKNMELLELYMREEEETLNKIYQTIKETKNGYISENTALIQNDANSLKQQINKLTKKRTLYIKVLENVIKRYNKATTTTKKIFNGDD